MKKYEVVISYIQDLIDRKNLMPGKSLPTIRFMVNELKVNKSTVQRAYLELEKNHVIYSIPKSGYYMIDQDPLKETSHEIIDLSHVVLEDRLLPYNEFNHCINKAIKLYNSNLFTYSDARGLLTLREVLVDHLKQNQVFTELESIVITSGTQQALHILLNIEFPNGKSVILIEEPSYDLFIKSAKISGHDVISIPLNGEGIDLKRLEDIFKTKEIKFFYTMPRLHNPLGVCYREKDKQKIVELAYKYDVFIVEDDYLSDIDYNMKRLPMHYYDTHHKVVYLKSYSKVFMPGMRIGAAVLPEKLLEGFSIYKSILDISAPLLSQGGLEVFIKSGMYNKHVKKIRTAYRKKMTFCKQLLTGLDTQMLNYHVPDTGFYIYLECDSVNMETLVHQLSQKNIQIKTCDTSYLVSDDAKQAIRLCVSGLSKDEISLSLRKIIDTINELLC
ncbi:MAG: PLP-dependent aminotransferase family protein [Clostridiales bacterium]|nr:PLP-dependent aminotransferase family protein [Clostridiales bacterium]